MPTTTTKITRREFVSSSAAAAVLGLLAPGYLLRAQQQTIVTNFTPLRRGTGHFTGRGGTIGWFIDKDALVVVDTQMPESASACLAGLAERSPRDIDLLINSHHHWDHTGGNLQAKIEAYPGSSERPGSAEGRRRTNEASGGAGLRDRNI